MELLERYLNQIKKYLPLKDKEDTIKELRSLILEEFDSRIDDTNKEEILYDIIKEYGYPVEVAARYRNTDPLISSVLRPFFYMALKIISAAVSGGMMIGTIVGYIGDNESFKLIDLLLEMAYAIPSIINALILGYGFVFLIFVLIEKYGKEEFKNEIPTFEPESLPSVPKDVFKISIFEHVFSIFAFVVFLYLLNYTEGLISITLDNIKYPLLNENFDNLLPFINFGMMFTLIITIIELSRQRRSSFTISFDLIQTMYFGIILLLLASQDIFTSEVIDGYNLGIIPNMARVMMYIGGVSTIIGKIYSVYKMKKTKINTEIK